MAWVTLELFCKSQLSILDCHDNGISNFDEPSPFDANSPTWDLSSRSVGQHSSEVETVVQTKKT